MSNEFIKAIMGLNLSTWYVLPLVGMNIKDFGSANLINTYLTRDGTCVIAEVKTLFDCNTQVCSNPHYSRCIEQLSSTLVVYTIEDCWKKDIKQFMAGKYSKMSLAAKELIIDGSTLTYRQRDHRTGSDSTDARLLALNKSDVLRRKWAEELGIDERELPEELMEAPKDSWFIDLNM